MSKTKIAIQGELGAYSHIAVENLYKDAEIKTCVTFEETFKQAFNDSNYKIVIPIENSLAGRVADIHYLLPKYKLQIHGEYFQAVEHNLLSKSDAKIEDIKYVRSHAQAIGQCQNLINKRKFKSIVSADTAGSAKDLAEGNDKSIAAIASELSAKIYNLTMNYLLIIALFSLTTFAHSGAPPKSFGFMEGMSHPIVGLDHLLAMLCVGMISSRIGGKAIWQVPSCFVLIMALGCVIGFYGTTNSLIEPIISLSVIVFGVLFYRDWHFQFPSWHEEL